MGGIHDVAPLYYGHDRCNQSVPAMRPAGRRRGREDQHADDRTGRLLLRPVQLHQRCGAVTRMPVPPTAGTVMPWYGRPVLQPDGQLVRLRRRQRRRLWRPAAAIDLTTTWGVNAALRALLEQAVADVDLRRLRRHAATTPPPMRTCALREASRCYGGSWHVRQQLAVLERRYPDPVQRRLADLYRSRRDLHAAQYREAAAWSATVAGSGAQPTRVRTVDDQSAWMAEFRFHRNFYP